MLLCAPLILFENILPSHISRLFSILLISCEHLTIDLDIVIGKNYIVPEKVSLREPKNKKSRVELLARIHLPRSFCFQLLFRF